jgi:hypothetical protein
MLIIDDYVIWWVSEARDEVWRRVFGFHTASHVGSNGQPSVYLIKKAEN